MRRRDFIAFLVGAAASGSTAVRAQPSVPVIGYLGIRTPEFDAAMVSDFRRGMSERGYVEGHNLKIEFRWAAGRFDRLPALAEELVRDHVGLIVTTGGTPAALAAKNATSVIPIVFAIGDDPVEFGLVASLNKPGGNITGVTNFNGALESKELGLLRELVPTATLIAVLGNPDETAFERQVRDAQAAARQIGQQLLVLKARTETEIEDAFVQMVRQGAGAVLLGANPFFATRAEKLFSLAARHSLPIMYWRGELARAGGLVSYGAASSDQFHQIGLYVGQILNGDQPSRLPVVQPTKFELVINLKAARSIGLNIPPTLLAIADEVIE
jgi:putative ABC transport system substrate-binding protein